MPPMLDIHLYVHGRGRGHASRALHLVAELTSRGHRARVFAGRDAVAVLGEVMPTTAIDSLPPTAGVDALATATRRIRDDVARMSAQRPDVVVSDGDLPSVCAARVCGVPSVAVGHGLVFLVCARPSGLPRLPWWREAMKAGVASLGAHRRIAVNFMSLPLRDPTAVLARPRSVARPMAAERRGVVAYFRDGVDARLLDAIREAAPTAQIFAPRGPRGVRPPDRDAFAEAFARARAVIATAGSQLIGECVASGTPLFAVHRRGDDEQRLNAELLARTGLGCAAPLDVVDGPMLRAFLERAPVPRGAIAAPNIDASTAVIDACEQLAGGTA
jgi:UDP-N-acetylglucosamine--N-acetylmuramyl-(pentapeptide) pyrophosphoryl-undecaprenol N-acetylglucosamine transferase